jgi:preprotein translocase subunit SecA
MPLVLAQAQDDAQQRAACFQALALARRLQLGADALLDIGSHTVHWTPAGLQRLEALGCEIGGAWINRRHREELVALALVALHALEPERDYLLCEGKVELLDRITGRRATGRVWSRGLQTLVELKEGCKPSAATHTAAQTSFQRFFARYHRLAGTSGTLRECRVELAAVYGRRVLHIPLRRACRRAMGPPRVFETQALREAAAVARVQELVARGRPVLVGVASVAAAQSLSAALQRSGIGHRVLDARHDGQEAQIVAAAGQAQAVTVATAMAGRGTDIVLGDGVAASGGLHVLNLLDSPCARVARQLVGRAARQGDPGSAETWHALDAPPWRDMPAGLRPRGLSFIPVQAASRLQQALHGWHGRRQRRLLLEQDLTWQRRLAFHSRHVPG